MGRALRRGSVAPIGCACRYPGVPVRCSPRSLAHDLVWGLVLAQSKEPGLAQTAVGCPLGETDLGDELRSHPMRARRNRACVDERRLGRLQLAQPGAEVAEGRRAVAGADPAGVTERSVLVVADEQRAEVSASAGGIGEAAD